MPLCKHSTPYFNTLLGMLEKYKQHLVEHVAKGGDWNDWGALRVARIDS